MMQIFPNLPPDCCRQLHDAAIIEDVKGAEKLLSDWRRANAHKTSPEWDTMKAMLHNGALNAPTRVDPEQRKRLDAFLRRIRWPD
jgi:hypothetical protein